MSTIQIAARPTAPTFVRPASTRLRLTRRGRALAILIAFLAVFAVAMFFGASSVATQEGGTPIETSVVTVGSGDTLWGIASDAAAPGETRAMMRTIQDINALDSVVVEIGQRLRVPAQL